MGHSSSFDEAQVGIVPPRYVDGSVDGTGGEDDGEVGPAVEADAEPAVFDEDVGGHVDQIAEDLPGLRIGVKLSAVSISPSLVRLVGRA